MSLRAQLDALRREIDAVNAPSRGTPLVLPAALAARSERFAGTTRAVRCWPDGRAEVLLDGD